MAKYEKTEVSKEVAEKAYEAIRLAKQSGSVRKGANEVTKSLERGLATFVVIAGDVTPEEVVMHLPMLCEQKKVPFMHVPMKLELGKAVGLGVPCTAVAVEKQGNADKVIKDITGRVSGKEAKPEHHAEAAKPEAKKEAAPKPAASHAKPAEHKEAPKA